MDAPTAASVNVTIRFNRFLPYWAVLQTDLRQTVRSWVYRLWVLLVVAAAAGSVVYKVGVHREAGIVQSASVQTGDLLRGLVAVSLALVALLAVSSVASERGTVADAILSRGISRHQYFLAKWHARVVVVLATFAALAAAVLAAHHFLFDSDLTLAGGLAAVAMVAAVLLVVISWGVTIGALSNGTVMGITLFWLALYGGLFLLSLLPEPYPTPDRVLARLKYVLRGQYDPALVTQVAAASAALSALAAAVGLVGFSRKDV
jgi:ABC-2 type transport system permease protein